MPESDEIRSYRRLFDIAVRVNAADSSSAAFRTALEGARELMGARLAAAVELVDGGLHRGGSAITSGDLPQDSADGLAGFLLRLIESTGAADRPLRLSRAALAAGTGQGGSPAPGELPPVNGCLLLRFVCGQGGRDVILALLDKIDGEFDAGDERALLEIGRAAGVAIARIRQLEATRAGKLRLRSALDGADEGLWDWDIAAGRMYHSPRWEAILGYGPDEREPSYDAWVADLHPEDRAATLAALDAMLSGVAAGFSAEYRMRSCSGEWLWVLDRGKVIERDGTGRALRAVGTFADDTERKRDALRYRHALEASNDGMWDWDVRSGVVYRSARYHEILGYRPGELADCYATWADSIHPDERETILRAFWDFLESDRESHQVEYRMRTRTGGWAWVLERSKVVERAADGRPLRVVGAQTDMTARRQAEEQLRTQEERLRAALSASMTGTYRWDIQADRLVHDESLVRLIGRPDKMPEESMGQFYDRVHPEDRDRVAAIIEQCLKDGEDLALDYRILLPDGTVRWMAERGKLFLDAAGAPLYMTGACTDITDRKIAEEALARSRDSAQAASRAKSEFLANMSHELRTPLNAVIGFSDAMLGGYAGALTPKQSEYAADIKASGQHLLEIVNDVLDLSKIEAGKLELIFEQLELADTISVCVGLMQARADGADLQLIVERPAAPATVWADDLRLRQILLNVLSNAVKFTPPGGRVTVTTEATEEAVRIGVADTGIGMREPDVALALEPFRQVDGSLARRYEGTGLGLPLVKTLTEMHGGTLEIESRLGEGTTVTVSLPQRRPQRQGQAA